MRSEKDYRSILAIALGLFALKLLFKINLFVYIGIGLLVFAFVFRPL